MRQICKFCKETDLQVHVPELTVDIAKAIESGVIPPTPNIQDFNNLDIDTVANGVRLREPFDAIEAGVMLESFNREYTSGTGNITTPTVPPTSATE